MYLGSKFLHYDKIDIKPHTDMNAQHQTNLHKLNFSHILLRSMQLLPSHYISQLLCFVLLFVFKQC